MNRRSFLKYMFGGLLTVGIVSGGTYFYAREIEPAMLDITAKTIVSDKIPVSFHNFKIVQFSDTHIGHHYDLKDVAKLVETINAEQPDVLVFTGDLIDDPSTYHYSQQLSNTLNQLHAPYGKYWVYGNHDHGGYGTDIVRNVMEKADFHLLQNSHKYIEKNNESIVFAGIDDVILGNPNVEQAIESITDEPLTILLAHEPDYADIAAQFPIDIQLSGHSHGGQVRFPLIGHMYTPAFAHKYIHGKYVFNNGDFELYVNKGIGTTRLPLRFLCVPEIHTFTLESGSIN